MQQYVANTTSMLATPRDTNLCVTRHDTRKEKHHKNNRTKKSSPTEMVLLDFEIMLAAFMIENVEKRIDVKPIHEAIDFVVVSIVVHPSRIDVSPKNACTCAIRWSTVAKSMTTNSELAYMELKYYCNLFQRDGVQQS